MDEAHPDWSEDGEPLMGESENSAQVELSLGSTDTDLDEARAHRVPGSRNFGVGVTRYSPRIGEKGLGVRTHPPL